MRMALEQAEQARRLGEVPVGCVVVKDGQIIGRGYNRRETDRTVLGHAELMAIRQAEQALGEMLDTGADMLKNSDRRAYYGVGAPTPMPFENDVVKSSAVTGHILRGYALMGLGRRGEAQSEIDAAAKISPEDFRIYAFEQILGTF